MDGLWAQRFWLRQGEKREHLRQVVLQDLTDNAKLVTVSAATIGAKWLLDRDLHV